MLAVLQHAIMMDGIDSWWPVIMPQQILLIDACMNREQLHPNVRPVKALLIAIFAPQMKNIN